MGGFHDLLTSRWGKTNFWESFYFHKVHTNIKAKTTKNRKMTSDGNRVSFGWCTDTATHHNKIPLRPDLWF